MDNDKMIKLMKQLKHTFSLKRTRITLYMAAVLWLAVVTQVVVNRYFQEEVQITEAFVKSDTEEMQSSLEVVAEYRTGVLSDAEKKDLINNLAEKIGLNMDEDITIWEEDTRSEYFIYKKAKKATTEIKIVSVEAEEDAVTQIKHYIIIRLSILQGIKSIDKYKSILEDALQDLDIKNKQITMEYEGSREGNLTSIQKHEIAMLLVNELQGKIALEYDEGDLYTVYAYTGMLNEYVTSLGNKINIQIAISYNELTNKTKITLATPIMNDSW